MKHLTQTQVRKLEPKDKVYVVRFGHPRGFAVKVHPSGVKKYVFCYTTQYARERQYTLCDVHDFSLAQAQELARQVAFDVHEGKDPLQIRRGKRIVSL